MFQSIGIKGAIYPFSQPAQNYSFPPPVAMKFDPLYLRNKVVLLLSDYTLNTVFNMAQQSGNVFTNINNDTTGLPFTVDTKGLGLILPELSQYFAPNNYVCNIKVGVMGIHKQPVISTQDDGSTLSLNFGMFIDVHNETSIEDEPFNAVNLNLDFNVKLKLSIDEDKLSILIGQISANKVSADSHIGPIDTEKSKKTLEALVKVAVTQLSGDLRKINIAEKLNNLTGLNFYDFVIDANAGHHAITFNYRDN